MAQLRISVVGCSGSGKSTLARIAGRSLDLPVLELDAVHHQAGWTPIDEPSFVTTVDDFMDQENCWVIDGNYPAVLTRVWARATHVVWMRAPRLRVMSRLFRRTLLRAIRREVLWNGNREALRDVLSTNPERSVLAWAWTRHRWYEQTYPEMLSTPLNDHLEVKELMNRRQGEAWIRSLTGDASTTGPKSP